MSDFLKEIEVFFTGKAWNIVLFLVVLVLGIFLIRVLGRLIRKAFFRTAFNKTLCSFLLAVIKFFLYIILLFVLADIAGISMTPLITALGAAGLAISLALQDSLSNIANGVLIVSTKPFTVGDFIEVDGVSGTVKAIRMITVELLTPDNKKITLPNSKVIGGTIINYSARPTRRIEFPVYVRYDTDIDLLKEVLIGLMAEHPLIMADPAPSVFLSKYKEQSLEFLARGWVSNADYWDVYWEMNEKILKALRQSGIHIPYNQVDVHIRDTGNASGSARSGDDTGKTSGEEDV